MDVVTLLAEARAAGLKVQVDGERLVIRGPRRAEALAHRVLERKAEVLATLSRMAKVTPTPYASPWPDALLGLGRRRVGPFAPCDKCGTGSWVRYGPAVRCLPCAQRYLVEMATLRHAGLGRSD